MQDCGRGGRTNTSNRAHFFNKSGLRDFLVNDRRETVSKRARVHSISQLAFRISVCFGKFCCRFIFCDYFKTTSAHQIELNTSATAGFGPSLPSYIVFLHIQRPAASSGGQLIHVTNEVQWLLFYTSGRIPWPSDGTKAQCFCATAFPLFPL